MEVRLGEEDEARDISNDSWSGIWNESRKLWIVALPSTIATLATFGTIMVVQAYLGHISSLDLSAFALSQSLVLLLAGGVLTGMSSATETLCGQAFGARQYHMLGIYLQRTLIINIITATLFIPLFIFTTPILKLIGEEDSIATEYGKFSLWLIPVLYSYAFRYTFQQFLQAQLKTPIVAWLFASSFFLSLFLTWLLYSKFEMRVNGVMGAFVVSSWMLVLGEFVYVCCGWCSNTWTGFTTLAFSDLFPAIKLSISSGVMNCVELWYSSVLVLVAGYFTDAEVSVSAFTICLSVMTCCLMISLGFQASTSVRVSNELGRGDAHAVKFAIKVELYTSMIIGAIFGIVCLAFSSRIAYIFTSEAEIVEYVSSLSGLIAFTVLLNSIQPVLTGVAVGAGMQGMVAVVNICSYYVVGLPMGILLGYFANLDVKGLWIGMVCGITVQTLVLGYMIWRTDWDDQVKRASERLNRWMLKPSDERESLIQD